MNNAVKLVILLIVIGAIVYLLQTPKFPIVYTALGTNTLPGFVWTDTPSIILLTNSSNISDISKLLTTGQLKTANGTILTPDYKYLSVTVSDGGSLSNYGYYYQFGKSLPNNNIKYLKQNALYGGGMKNKFLAGRKPDSPFSLENKLVNGDSWPGTTWAIYKLN
jgi:hypothetical protein